MTMTMAALRNEARAVTSEQHSHGPLRRTSPPICELHTRRCVCGICPFLAAHTSPHHEKGKGGGEHTSCCLVPRALAPHDQQRWPVGDGGYSAHWPVDSRAPSTPTSARLTWLAAGQQAPAGAPRASTGPYYPERRGRCHQRQAVRVAAAVPAAVQEGAP